MTNEELSPLQKSALIIKKLKLEVESLKKHQDDIAIVGMACRFPGNANTPEQFWELLQKGQSTVTEIPQDRFDISSYYDASPASKGKINTKYAHLITNPLDFDPAFFNLSNRETESLDPQHRLLLEVSWQALENAGIDFNRLNDSQTGVFLGIGQIDYLQRQLDELSDEQIDTYANSGNSFSFAAGRLAYYLGLRGPCMAVDTACSSSLTALHLACNSLALGESDQAIVAGVQLILSPKTMIGLSRLRALSPSGCSKAFAADADGFGRGEGCGVVILKRLADALTSQDNILAVIKATHVNHNGESSGLTVPNGYAQRDLISKAFEKAQLRPEMIDYIEAHGTGTELGDPIEVDALAGIFKNNNKQLKIGSVKGNIGHLEAAAGIASLIKVILSLKYELLPQSLHSRSLNPHIDWQNANIAVVQNNLPWPKTKQQRYAGISSFGMSGTNAHAIITDYLPEKPAVKKTRALHLFTLSAKDEWALKQKAGALHSYLTDFPEIDLMDFCFTSNCGRAQFAYRAATTFRERSTLLDFLQSIHSGMIKAVKAEIKPKVFDAQQLKEQGIELNGTTQRGSITEPMDTELQGQLLVELFLSGYRLELNALYPDSQKCLLPTYPFRHKPYWYSNRDDVMEVNTMNDTDLVLEQLKINLAKLLGAKPQELDSNSSLLELGADSIVLVEAIEMVEKLFQLKLSVRQLFEEFNTLSALAAYIAKHRPVKKEVITAVETTAITPPNPAEELSPSEANIRNEDRTCSPSSSSPQVWAEGKNELPLQSSGAEQIISQQLRVMEQLFTQQLAVLNKQSSTTPVNRAAQSTGKAVRGKPAPTSTRPWAAIQTQRRELSKEQQSFLEQFIADYNKRTKQSKAQMEQSRQVIADFRNSVGFRLETKEILYPIVCKQAAGSHIWDIDGNEYIDYCLGYGVHFFGHSPAFLDKALKDKISEGYAIGPQSHLSLSAGNLIKKMTGMTRVAFCNSGTHAVDTAIRIARAYSQKNKIISFSSSYHGHSDHTLAFSRKKDDGYESFPIGPGISEALIQDVVVLPYADEAVFAYIRQHADEIAAILVEPVQSRQPDLQPRDFLKQLRQLTEECKLILIFDEMVNGFRIHQGGAQAWFGVQADIVTYGKLIASGLPIGVVAARGDFLDCLDGGAWEFGDESYPQKETTFFGGTFNQNPLTMAAAEAVLRYLKEEGPSLQEELNQRAESLVSRVNAFLSAEDYPLKVVNFGTMFRFTMPGNASYLYQPLEMDLFYAGMIHRGIYIWEGRTCYISTAHTEADLDYFVAAVQDTLMQLRSNGFFPGKIPAVLNASLAFPSVSIKSHLKTIYGIHQQSTSSKTQQQTRFWERSQSKLAQLGQHIEENPETEKAKLKIGISFFGTYSNDYNESKYDLVLSASRFADSHGFSAVWLPERHFHEFGGLSPNPSVLCSAISQVTQNINLRAGSVVLPLHHPIRVAEDWAIIDNLSNGRTGIAFASGWHPDDFILAQNTYGQQRDVMLDAIPVIQDLWRGNSVKVDGVKGKPRDIKLYPMPKQKELPIWLTIVNSTDMYKKAGQMGAGILTNLLGQSIEDLRRNIAVYRESLKAHGYAPQMGNVTVLLHTYLDADAQLAVNTARKPFCDYLKSSVGLFKNLIANEQLNIDVDTLSEEDKDFILAKAYDNYVKNSALIGSPQSVQPIINQLYRAGVDEIACFIDFGIDPDKAQKGLIYINELKDLPQGDKAIEYPLTREQRQIFALNRINPTAYLAYNEACVLKFKGLLNVDHLEQSIHYAIKRHPALRTVINEGGLSQRILADYKFSLLRQPANEINSQITAFRDQPFNLNKDLPIRALLLSFSAEQHILVLVVNHILIDGWSIGVILKDISQYYTARSLNKPLSVDDQLMGFDTFIHLRQERLLSAEMATHKEFWLKQFQNGIPRTQLPYKQPLSNQFSSQARRQSLQFNSEQLELLNRIAGEQKSTLFMLLFATYSYLLHFITQQETIMVGIPVSGRTHKDDNILVGYCTYLLPIICHYEQGESFQSYLMKIKGTLLDAFEHQAYPFGSLTEALAEQGFSNPSEMIKVIFNLDRPLNIQALAHIDVQIEEQEVQHKVFDLDFNLLNLGDRLILDCDYRSECFSETTIASWLSYYQAMIQLILNNNQLVFSLNDILSAEEKNELANELFPCVNIPLENLSITSVFAQRVAENPEATALISEHETWSYQQLDEQSNQLANYLSAMGVGQGMVIAVFLERSIDLITTLLAIVKLGAAYLILDTKNPVSRTAAILEDALAAIIVSNSELADELPPANGSLLCLDEQASAIATESKQFELPTIQPDDLAYICYTSGTTGKPKGVMIAHRGVLRLCQNANYVNIKPEDVFIQLAAVSFDATTFEIWACLLNGAKLVIPDAGLNSMDGMAELLSRHQVTILWLTAGLFQLFVQHHLEDLSSVKQLIAGGDILSVEHVNQFIQRYPHHALINGYGPTEATTFACTYLVSANQRLKGSVPIGRPINNTQAYILDERLNLVPKGAIGELYIAGDGLALGYLNDSQLTDERFIVSPYLNKRMYKTGDLVRCNEENAIEFIGRKDKQIKINGYRIEAHDIENAFNQWEKLSASKLMCIEEDSNKKLVLFYYDLNQEPLTSAELRKYASGLLPSYAIPHHFVAMKQWPLTSNGKVDTKRLLKEFSLYEEESLYEAPQGDLEQSIAAIWQQLFKVETLGRHSDFFALGGDSITALQMSSLLKEATGYTVNPNHILIHPSISELASYLQSDQQEKIVAKELQGEVPLTAIQSWFFRQQLAFPDFFLQSICLEVTQDVDNHLLAKALMIVMRHYDAFRLRFKNKDGLWTQYYLDQQQHEPFVEQVFSLFDYADTGIDKTLQDFQAGFDIEKGPVFKVACFIDSKQQAKYLVFSVHHLIVDGVSWRIIFNSLMTVYEQLVKNVNPSLSALSSSFKDWSLALRNMSSSGQEQVGASTPLDFDYPEEKANQVKDERLLFRSLPLKNLKTINQACLLTSVFRAFKEVFNLDALTIDVEGHGRDLILSGIDVSNTVGWFTNIVPFNVQFNTPQSIDEQILACTQNSLLLSNRENAEVCFNYLGNIDQTISQNAPFRLTKELNAQERHAEQQRLYEIEITAQIVQEQLEISLYYPAKKLKDTTINLLLDSIIAPLGQQEEISFSKPVPNLANLVIPLNALKNGQGSVIFIPGTGGNIIYFHPLVKKLKIGLPCFGIQALGLYDDFSPLNQISEIVETYIKAIKEAGLKPPYHFLGHSLGAITVFELVQALRKKEDIGQVILLDMMAPTKDSKPSHFPVNNQEWILYALRHMERYLQTPLVIDTAMPSIANSEEKYELFKQALVSAGVIPASTNREVVRKFVDVLINNTLAYKNYCPTGKAMHPLHLVKASEIHDDDFRPEVLLHSPDWGWQQFADRVVVHQMSLGDHLSIFAEPAVNQLAEIIEQIFAQEIVNA